MPDGQERGAGPRALTEDEQETYEQCRGHCRVCLWEGGCGLEDKLKARRELCQERR